jgi:hypothetical protein
MSEAQKRNFYGDDGRPSILAVIAMLRTLTGSEACAKELIDAADEVERTCAGAALTPMPEWVC